MDDRSGRRERRGISARLVKAGEQVADTRRRRVLRLVWEASHVESTILYLAAIAAGCGPSLIRAAAAWTVVLIPALDEPNEISGRLGVAILLLGVGLFVASLAGVLRDSLGRILSVRLTHHLQRRLMQNVGQPVGISHLASTEVETDLAAAQGSLGSYWPAEAPGQLARLLSMRIDGLLALVPVALVRWWLACILLVFWLILKRNMKVVVLQAVQSIGGETSRVVKARYLERVLASPDAGREVRVFGIFDWLRARFLNEWTLAMKDTWRILGTLRLRAVQFGLAAAVVLGLSYWVVLSDAFTSDISLFLALMAVLSLPITGSLGLLGEAGVLLEFTLGSFPEIESAKAQRTTAETDEPLRRMRPDEASEIRFENVSFGYGDVDVLSDLNLTIRTGETCAIVGLNGAGKSTVIALLLRLLEPTEGRILADDIDVKQIDAEYWREGLSGVFQDYCKLPFTLAENVASADPDADEERVREAVRLAGFESHLGGLVDGFDTPLTSRVTGGTDLSGGQWQRIAIARMFYERLGGASLLVLDEPTSALDADGELEVYAEILRQSSDATMVLTSHRFATVRMVDKIHVLEGGSIIESGSHDQLMGMGGRYASMFTTQASVYT